MTRDGPGPGQPVGDAAVDFASLARRFVAAQLAADRAEALRLVVDEGVKKGAPVIELEAQVIAAAQREIGRLWESNTITVAQEHLATGISQVVMSRLFELVKPSPRNGRRVAVACVEGEHHDFPARLVADYLDHAGFIVDAYGADLPTAELVKRVRRSRPDAVALSATMTHNLPALQEAVRQLRAEQPGLPILAGGYAVAWSGGLASALGVATSGPTPDEVIDVARRLTGVIR